MFRDAFMKARIVFLLVLVFILGGAVGVIVGSKYSALGHQSPLQAAIEEEPGSLNLYTYYIDAAGKKVLHGGYYTVVSPTFKMKKTFRDGLLQGVESTSVNH